MKNYVLETGFFTILLLVALQISGCNISDNDDDEFTDRYSYQIKQESAIAVDSVQRPTGEDSTATYPNFSITPGDSTVFVYRHDVIPPKNVADGGFSETLVFQIPADANQFEVTAESFSEMNAFYRFSCFCQFGGLAFPATGGTIRGEKISPVHWIINADVTIQLPYGDEEISFEEPFFVN